MAADIARAASNQNACHDVDSDLCIYVRLIYRGPRRRRLIDDFEGKHSFRQHALKGVEPARPTIE